MNIYIEYTMVESEQSDKKSLDIAEWNPLISKRKRYLMILLQKYDIRSGDIFAVDVFEKLNELNVELNDIAGKKIV